MRYHIATAEEYLSGILYGTPLQTISVISVLLTLYNHFYYLQSTILE